MPLLIFISIYEPGAGEWQVRLDRALSWGKGNDSCSVKLGEGCPGNLILVAPGDFGWLRTRRRGVTCRPALPFQWSGILSGVKLIGNGPAWLVSACHGSEFCQHCGHRQRTISRDHITTADLLYLRWSRESQIQVWISQKRVGMKVSGDS